MSASNDKQPAQAPKAAATGGASRRDLLRAGTVAAASTLAFPYIVKAQVAGANNKIRIAAIGVGGKGGSDIDQAAEAGAEIVGLCDVDANTLNGKAKKYGSAKLYKDFRKMLEEMDKSVDAVIVSTPDHLHGIACAMALKMGKHVYCQKPLTQTVSEARALRQLINEKKVATQMGNQGSATPGLRRAVEVIQAGLIGPVRELHVWSNRPVWPQGLDRPQGQDPVPAHLDWDLWLGPAQMRPYKEKAYHTFAWRGWYDFGTGALGDMACHTVNMPFRALKLGYPTVVENEMSSKIFSETFPKSSRIRFEFPERDGMPPLKFWWYDGNPDPNSPHHIYSPLRPNADLVKDIVQMRGKLPPSGALLIGDKGIIFSPDDYGQQFYVKLKGEEKFRGGFDHEAAKAIATSIPRAPEQLPAGAGGGQPAPDDKKPKKIGEDLAMKVEWMNMMRDPNQVAYSNFDNAAYLTEIILLGCIATRVGEGVRMEWDGPNMKSPNVPEAAKFVKRESRPGWEI
jgi:hypothetical protein